MPTRKLVVAGLIAGADDSVLITQRREDQALPLYWELPGGKVEPGEHPQVALARELREELGVRARVGRIWEVVHHRYPDYEVVMLVYRCSIDGDQSPRCVEVKDLAWVPLARLPEYRLLPADAPLIERLRSESAVD